MAGKGPKELSLLRYSDKIKSRIVARTEEIRNILATLDAGRHLIFEGPPGTTKSTILRTITEVCRVPFYLIEGNVDLTPSKLVGHFNPAKVMADDYKEEYFEKGPLTRAMEGGILYIDEFNRMPPDTGNVLITAVDEGKIHIPRYRAVKAHASRAHRRDDSASRCLPPRRYLRSGRQGDRDGRLERGFRASRPGAAPPFTPRASSTWRTSA